MPSSISSALNREKKRVRLRVVITVSLGTHTLPQAVNIKKSSIFNRRILTAAIRVNNRAAFYQTAPPRLTKSVNDQLRRHSLRDLPTDNSSGELILKRRQIAEPPVLKRQICNVADHHLSFLLRLARRLQQIRTVSEVVLWIGRSRHEAFRADRPQRLFPHQWTGKSAPDRYAGSFEFGGNSSRPVPPPVQIENLFDRLCQLVLLPIQTICFSTAPSVIGGFAQFQRAA